MSKNHEARVTCQICRQPKKMSEVMPAELVREPIVQTILKTHPAWSTTGFICIRDLDRFRNEHIEDVLEEEKGELSTLDEQVMQSLRDQELLARDVNEDFERRLTVGERLADRIADFGGSWRFMLIFAFILFVWIGINSVAIFRRPFDPFPYILLNLILSCLAAIQAPVIMMSQNRQESKDRLRSENDYKVNLRAELEIRHLHAKMDQLLHHQWQRLLEIQQIQMELMEEVARRGPKGAGT